MKDDIGALVTCMPSWGVELAEKLGEGLGFSVWEHDEVAVVIDKNEGGRERVRVLTASGNCGWIFKGHCHEP